MRPLVGASFERSCLMLIQATVSCSFALQANLNIESQGSRFDSCSGSAVAVSLTASS